MSTIANEDRHDADGKAYIAYFLTDPMMHFIWDGDSDSPVQVTHGESGEPITATFEVSIAQDQNTIDVLVRFKYACNLYAIRSKVPDTVYLEAEAAYTREDQGWFNNLSTEVLVAMWALCCEIETCPSWDDEVYDALHARGHFDAEANK